MEQTYKSTPFNEVMSCTVLFQNAEGVILSIIASKALRTRGAAEGTNIIIIAQAIIHDLNRWLTDSPLWMSGALAFAEVIAVVNPDRINPNRKCL